MRQITTDDFDTVYDIYMDKTVNPYMAYDPMTKEEFKPIFENELLKRDHYWLFQYEEQDVAMGSVVLENGRCTHSANIYSLGILPAFQNKGLGKDIMNAIIDFLKAKGIKRIALGAESDNERAIAFYKKLGFQVEGILKNYMKRRDQNHYVDEIMMALTFN